LHGRVKCGGTEEEKVVAHGHLPAPDPPTTDGGGRGG